jgi:hypothetical protein
MRRDRTRRRYAVLIGLLIFCGMSSPSQAASAAAEVLRVESHGADAFFSDTDATGCIVTGILAIARTDRGWTIDSVPIDTASVSVVISQVDICNVVQILTGNGVSDHAAFSVTPNLDSASASAVVPILNGANGQLVYVSVNLSFLATSAITASAGAEKIDGYNIASRVLIRSATAIASITVDGRELAPNPSVEAHINTVNAGAVTVAR